ncbi:hypothetical protein D3C75_1006270 [compost metagenome]
MAVAKQRGRCRDLFFIEGRALTAVGRLAGGVLVHPAEKAVTAGNDEGDHHPVALAQILHLSPGLHHLAHKFMAKNIAMFYLRDLAAVEMQIRPADRGGGNAQNDVVSVLDDRIGNRLNANAVRAVIRQCFHATSG